MIDVLSEKVSSLYELISSNSSYFFDKVMLSLPDFVSVLTLHDPYLIAQNFIIPVVILTVISGVILSMTTNKSTLARTLIAGIMTFLASRYMLWRLVYTFNAEDTPNFIFSCLFFIAEFILITYTVFAIFILQVNTTDRRKEAQLAERQANELGYYPSVDIFVATYNEPLELLKRTALGCKLVNYPNYNIYFLDDGRRPELKAMCDELGCHYITRNDNKHYKAGNLNNALVQTSGDLILFLDADFVPTKRILTHLRGLFLNDNVAIVQTPQSFNNFDAISHNLGLAGRLTNEQDIFFRVGQPSRDYHNATICHGTCFVARRSDLEAIGGVPTETLSEDFLTSLKLQMNKKQVIYVNEVLASGFVPDNVLEYVKQRSRWCTGTLQVLFSSVNPLKSDALSFMQKLHHFMGIMYWFTFIGVAILFLLPLGYLFFELQPLRASFEELIFYMLPLFVGSILFTNWMNFGRRSFFWSAIYDLVIAFPMATNVIQTLIKPFGTPFNVTAKDSIVDKATLNIAVATPLITVLCLYIVGLTYQIGFRGLLDSPTSSEFIIIFWVIYNSLSLWLAIMSCIDAPQRRGQHRFNGVRRNKIVITELAENLKLRELSDNGFSIEIPKTDQQATQFDHFKHKTLSVLFDVDKHLKAKVIDVEFDPKAKTFIVRFQFDFTTTEEYQQVVDLLYCNRASTPEVIKNENIYLMDFCRSIVRFYPLTNS